MTRLIGRFAALVLAGSGLLDVAQAAEIDFTVTGTIFEGLDLKADSTVTKVPMEAREAFVKSLVSFSSDGLDEAFKTPTATKFGLFATDDKPGGIATLEGASSTKNRLQDTACGLDGSCTGRFNTSTTPSPGPWWESSISFQIVFDGTVNAFGFDATDVGDFDGTLKLTLTDSAMNTSVLDVASGTKGGPNGSLLFFGFSDASRDFTRVEFTIVQTTSSDVDYFGFDRFVVGPLKPSPPTDVPEPATLVLVAASLAALAATRRRRPR
jgi:hypothetical protein